MELCHLKQEPDMSKYANKGTVDNNNDSLLTDFCETYETFTCIKHEYELSSWNLLIEEMENNIKLEHLENESFNVGYKNNKRHSQNVLDQPDRLNLKAVSARDKENFIPGTDIAVDSDDNDYIDVVTVDTENQNVIVNSTQCTDDDNNDNLLTLDSSHDVRGTPVDSQTQSQPFSKTKENSVIILKDAKVALERLSTIKILEYTTKSDADKEHTNGKVFKSGMKFMFKHYCLTCNKTRKVSSVFIKNNCPECEALMIVQCLKCEKKYNGPTGVIYHLQTQCGLVKRFDCSKCDFTTSMALSLNRHKNRVHAKEITKQECPKCRRMLKNLITLKSHLRHCGKEPDLCCKLCPYKTKFSKNLKNHINSHKTIDKRRIRYKKIEYESSSNEVQDRDRYTLRAHYNQFCLQCNESFKNFVYNRSHCQKCKSELLLQCLKCGQKYKDYKPMYYHLKSTCVPEATFQCSKCEFSTKEHGNLKRHIKRKHSVVDLKEVGKCPKCVKSFRIIDDLKAHIKGCGTEPHLRCDHCPFKTKYRESIMHHVHAHLTGKTKKAARKPRFTPAFCQECNIFRKDAKQSTLCPKCKTVLVFRCTECNVETASREALRLHETEKHQFEYKYQCSICDKEFAQPQNLKFHLRVCKRKLNLP